jgi:hypothetical protein
LSALYACAVAGVTSRHLILGVTDDSTHTIVVAQILLPSISSDIFTDQTGFDAKLSIFTVPARLLASGTDFSTSAWSARTFIAGSSSGRKCAFGAQLTVLSCSSDAILALRTRLTTELGVWLAVCLVYSLSRGTRKALCSFAGATRRCAVGLGCVRSIWSSKSTVAVNVRFRDAGSNTKWQTRSSPECGQCESTRLSRRVPWWPLALVRTHLTHGVSARPNAPRIIVGCDNLHSVVALETFGR